jgi:serine/threonine-protein kinase RsbT
MTNQSSQGNGAGSEFEQVLALLQRYISPVNARSLLLRALQQHGISPAKLTRGDLAKCGSAFRRGVALFADPLRRDAALQEINAHCGTDAPEVRSCTLQIAAEFDIGKARAETRRICDAVGANAFTVQRVATIVSELARNMVLYATGGVVEVAVLNSPKRILVRATDYGSGIPNLEEVMSGRYRSKTGMGRGLLGTKRLADRFDISTGSTGTRVTAEVTI